MACQAMQMMTTTAGKSTAKSNQAKNKDGEIFRPFYISSRNKFQHEPGIHRLPSYRPSLRSTALSKSRQFPRGFISQTPCTARNPGNSIKRLIEFQLSKRLCAHEVIRHWMKVREISVCKAALNHHLANHLSSKNAIQIPHPNKKTAPMELPLFRSFKPQTSNLGFPGLQLRFALHFVLEFIKQDVSLIALVKQLAKKDFGIVVFRFS